MKRTWLYIGAICIACLCNYGYLWFQNPFGDLEASITVLLDWFFTSYIVGPLYMFWCLSELFHSFNPLVATRNVSSTTQLRKYIARTMLYAAFYSCVLCLTAYAFAHIWVARFNTFALARQLLIGGISYLFVLSICAFLTVFGVLISGSATVGLVLGCIYSLADAVMTTVGMRFSPFYSGWIAANTVALANDYSAGYALRICALALLAFSLVIAAFRLCSVERLISIYYRNNN